MSCCRLLCRSGCIVLSASDIRAGRSVQCWFSTDKIFYVHIICLSTQVCVWESVSQLLLFARTCDQYICKNQPNEISINSVKIPSLMNLALLLAHILLNVLHTFLMEQVRRICLIIKRSYPWRSLSLFSSLECLNKQ